MKRQPLNYNNAAACAGFTLVEAVLALAILGIGLFVIIEATARCLAVIRVARNYQTARAALELGEAAYPLLYDKGMDDNSVSETVYPGGITFAREITPVDGEEKLFIVTTRVKWSEFGSDSMEVLTSYVYLPNTE